MELLKFTSGQIRAGGRRPNWKRSKHYNSVATRQFYLKLSTLMHYRPLCHRPSGNRTGYRSTRGLTTNCACWCASRRSSRRRRTSPTCWHLSVSSVQSLSILSAQPPTATTSYRVHVVSLARGLSHLQHSELGIGCSLSWKSTCSIDSFKRSIKSFLFQSTCGCETWHCVDWLL